MSRAVRLIPPSNIYSSLLLQRPAIIPDCLSDHARIGLGVMGLEYVGGIAQNLCADFGRNAQTVQKIARKW